MLILGGDNMIYPSIDKLLNQVGSKYLLVNLVSKRVKEMEKTEFCKTYWKVHDHF